MRRKKLINHNSKLLGLHAPDLFDLDCLLKTSLSKIEKERVAILFWLTQGLKPSDVAERKKVSLAIVYRIAASWRLRGIVGIADGRKGTIRRKVIEPDQRKSIFEEALLCLQKRGGRDQSSCARRIHRYITVELGIKVSMRTAERWVWSVRKWKDEEEKLSMFERFNHKLKPFERFESGWGGFVTHEDKGQPVPKAKPKPWRFSRKSVKVRHDSRSAFTLRRLLSRSLF